MHFERQYPYYLWIVSGYDRKAMWKLNEVLGVKSFTTKYIQGISISDAKPMPILTLL